MIFAVCKNQGCYMGVLIFKVYVEWLLRAISMVFSPKEYTCGLPPRNREMMKSFQVLMLPVQPFDIWALS